MFDWNHRVFFFSRNCFSSASLVLFFSRNDSRSRVFFFFALWCSFHKLLPSLLFSLLFREPLENNCKNNGAALSFVNRFPMSLRTFLRNERNKSGETSVQSVDITQQLLCLRICLSERRVPATRSVYCK